jgi:hypothetical protein
MLHVFFFSSFGLPKQGMGMQGRWLTDIINSPPSPPPRRASRAAEVDISNVRLQKSKRKDKNKIKKERFTNGGEEKEEEEEEGGRESVGGRLGEICR